MHGRFTSVDPIILSGKRMVNPQIWNSYSYAGNNPLKYADPNGMERVLLGQHTDDEIEKRNKAIDAEKKANKADKTLSKDQIKEKNKTLDAEKKTLGIEKEGNRVVGAMLKALDKVGERNGLQLKDFTLSTNLKEDFAGATPEQMKILQGSEAFVAQLTPTSPNSIYIRMDCSDCFYQQASTFTNPDASDYVFKGAGILRHEQYHRDEKDISEGPAYRVERTVFNKFKNDFRNQQLYLELDNVIQQGIKNNP